MDPTQTDQPQPSNPPTSTPQADANSQWQYSNASGQPQPQPQQPAQPDPAQYYQYQPQPQPQTQDTQQYQQPAQPAVDPTYQAYVDYYYQQWQENDPAGYQAYLQAYHQQAHEQPQPSVASPQASVSLPHQPVEPATPRPVQDIQSPADTSTGISQANAYQLLQAAAQNPAVATSYSPEQTVPGAAESKPSPPSGLLAKLKQYLFGSSESKRLGRYKPLLTAALVGVLVFGLFNSQLIIGQLKYLVSPQADAQDAGIQDSGAVGAESTVVIPKINVNAPVVYDEPTFDEGKIQKALERGVVHYGNTAVPGQKGNVVIVGHSSNNWWAAGKYKFAFVLLDKLEVGDTFNLHFQGKRYVYQITEKKVIDPKDVSVLNQNVADPVATLITCTPPGTSLHRLYVQGKQINPDPKQASPAITQNQAADSRLIPGNTPSLLEQFKRRIFGD